MKRERFIQHSKPRRTGAAAVEFAILVPVLLTIVFGAVDLGQYHHAHYGVINSARTAAGHAAMSSVTSDAAAWHSEIRQVALNEMDQLNGFDATLATVTAVRDFSDGPVPRLRVTVQYPFSTIVGWPLLPTSFQLVHTAEIRAIR